MAEKEQRYIEVLMEEMNDKFSLVLEGHAAIRQEFKDSHRELEEKINLNSSLIKFGFETLDVKIDGVRTELRETREELREEMASGFNALGSKVEGHEDRIRFLERKVA